MQFPVEILDDWCKNNNLPEPEWSPDHTYVIIDGTKYTLDQFGELQLVEYLRSAGLIQLQEHLRTTPIAKLYHIFCISN